ncbi:MAG: alpha/beta fold hydrolase [Actinomycetota bacterium]
MGLPSEMFDVRSMGHLVVDRLRMLPPDERLVAGVISFALDGPGGASARPPGRHGSEAFSLQLSERQRSFSWGLHPQPDATVYTDASTLRAILDDRRSGVDAFLRGDLRVRGNLALALSLNRFWSGEHRPAHFPAAQLARVGGHDAFYLDAGSGEAVVLLHGLGATNASMLPTLDDLARDYRVVAPDLPGFGESGKPITSLHAGFYARWLCDFLDHLGIERAHLIGNSLGGRVALEMGLSHPDRVQRMILLAPSPAFIKGRQFVKLVRVLRPELALLPTPVTRKLVLGTLRSLFSQPARLADAWYEAAADEFLRVFSTPVGRICFFSAARQIYLEEPYGEDGFWDRLPGLSVPSLFVWGARDRLVPASFARHVDKCLPQGDSVVLDDCGHVPQYELPERTHGLIREHLRR